MRLPEPDPMDFRVLSVACFRLTFLPLESTTPFSSHSWHAFCRLYGVQVSFMGPKGQSQTQTHLPFLEEAVEVCIPDLDRSEFEKSQ
jgi:hypothetical protein